MNEAVNHPNHYGGEGNPYETIKVLRAWDLQMAKGFCWGNLIKYVSRAGKKDAELKDLEKAAWYANELADIQREIETSKSEEPRTHVDPALSPCMECGALSCPRGRARCVSCNNAMGGF